MNSEYLVSIVMGSDSDLKIVSESCKILDILKISYKVSILSAHRTPEELKKHIKDSSKFTKIYIAAAGGAAHLAGTIAALTSKPVIGIPISSNINGIDSLYSTVQMPGGVPVATMSIGKAGAVNAAIYAAKIISLFDNNISNNLDQYILSLKSKVITKNDNLQELGYANYIKKFIKN